MTDEMHIGAGGRQRPRDQKEKMIWVPGVPQSSKPETFSLITKFLFFSLICDYTTDFKVFGVIGRKQNSHLMDKWHCSFVND